MYTEENEFNYNDYLEEGNQYVSNNKSNKGLIIKILIILICLALIIFFVFKFLNKNNNNSDNNDNNNLVVFNNNISILKSAGEEYFFEKNNLPKNVNDTKTVNINDLKEENLIIEIEDYEGNKCSYNTSYITLTKNSNDYKMQINLKCSEMEDSVVYYYDLEGNCLTCNGEEYVPSENDKTENNKQDNDNSSNDETEDEENKPILPVCGNFGEWTTEEKNDPNLEVESRVVVMAYKENYTYGDWSEPTLTPITPSDTLLVKTETKQETVTTTSDWSKETTTKPAEKEGREIKTREERVPYTKKSCSTKTYTKELTYWDNSAKSCTSPSIGKVICTYEKQVCSNVTKYKKVTYYKYQDTTTSLVTNTYYSSRSVIKNATTYTDYILEEEIPDGYTKVADSEITQYRYREKCSK